ncbi:hypothetical protein [Haloprofundus halobius]|uniref:hypothetical protein n=1 Tax=Haloprofundus halobius TaxID=2876194 RepID=UPI001CCF6716|nr:hypothetical protein [Haloprofundus halobius]
MDNPRAGGAQRDAVPETAADGLPVFESTVPALETEDIDVETESRSERTSRKQSSRSRGMSTRRIVFAPRDSRLLARLLTGDVERQLTTRSDRPVVALPRQRE